MNPNRRLSCFRTGFRCLVAAFALPLVVSPVRAQSSAERMVPLTGSRTIQDSMGFQWDVSMVGSITNGTNRAFQTAGHLMVGGASFAPTRRMISPDGQDMVFEGTRSGIEITRRVRVDPTSATLRYADTFTNPGASSVTLDVKVVSSLRTSVGEVITDTGRVVSPSGSSRVLSTTGATIRASSTTALGTGECGLLVLRTSSNYPAVLFFLASPKSGLRPTIQRQGSYQFVFTYSVELPPRRSVSIVHGLAQRNIRTAPSGQDLTNQFKPFLAAEWTRGLPLVVRRSIMNSGRPTFVDETPDSFLKPVLELALRWGVDRGASDVLVQDEKSQLSGSVAGHQLTVSTRFGDSTVPLEEVALLIGGSGVGRSMRVYLRDGEILVGRVEAMDLSFESDTGLRIELNPAQIEALFLRKEEDDGQPPSDSVAMVRTLNGDQLALGQSLTSIRATSGWGPIEAPLSSIANLYPVRDPQPMHRLVLRDQSRLSVFLDSSDVELPSLRFGKIKLNAAAISRLAGADVSQADDEEPEIDPDLTEEGQPTQGPFCQLLGNNIISGTIDAAALELVTDAGSTPVDARLITQIRRDTEDAQAIDPRFAFELANGTRLVGRFSGGVFPLQAMGRSWQVPSYHLLVFQRPEPRAEGTIERAAGQVNAPLETAGQSNDAPPAQPSDSEVAPAGGGN